MFVISSRLVATFDCCTSGLPSFIFPQFFLNAVAFNQDLSPWNVGTVTGMDNMFNGATAFSQVLCWDTSGKTTTDMFTGSSGSLVGDGTGACNPLTDSNFKPACAAWLGGDTVTYGHIKDWKTGAVTDMSAVFQNAGSFNDDISGWNTGQVIHFFTMFQGATIFNQNIGSWDTSKATSLRRMFLSASAFDQPIGLWDTSSVNSLDATFYDAGAFNQDIGSWNTGLVPSLENTFGNAASFNQDISSWDVSSVTNMGDVSYERMICCLVLVLGP
jgi:surface protein